VVPPGSRAGAEISRGWGKKEGCVEREAEGDQVRIMLGGDGRVTWTRGMEVGWNDPTDLEGSSQPGSHAHILR
jgi:hypothetical protein